MNKLFIPLIALMAMQGMNAQGTTLYTSVAHDSTEVKAKKALGEKGEKTEKSNTDKKKEAHQERRVGAERSLHRAPY